MNHLPDHRTNHETVNMMYGTYADVIFILFPFAVIALTRAWHGHPEATLTAPDLSIAAAILGGLALGKFVLGLITDHNLSRFRERIVFFLALTLLLVLGPAILMLLLITTSEQVPRMVVFVQPILLIVAISLYTTAISISNLLTRPDPVLFAGEDPEQSESEGERELELPGRDGESQRMSRDEA
ncbi:hypothetical protein [Vreelandella utahensis]|uniref:hypothetical protein n=1 Tax=Vreelandella halophila TaxID=86177 RepID=UPI0009854A0C|nr:hypothetical protein [Halomonas utahensis]